MCCSWSGAAERWGYEVPLVTSSSGTDGLLREQVRYYRERASEYDDWFFRWGRYDRGPEHREAWFAEAGEAEARLRGLAPLGDVLELACGTGLWTRILAPLAAGITAVDASPEALALAGRRLRGGNVAFVEADIFSWTPPRRFDFIFLGFWISHVPEDRFDSFWERMHTFLKPGGRVAFIDSRPTQASTARDHPPLSRSGVVERLLDDGRRFRIVKVFREAAELTRRLDGLGWTGEILETERFFVHGSVAPRPTA